ncbi:MAG: response regulator transcription factor [Gammaproteobacteria bacterium]|nr:response regulator transcription factor [Gammaproteobacteria bacterium]
MPNEKNINLLIIDDDQEIADNIKNFLTRHQFNPIVLTDPTQAIELLKRNPIDLIILDLMMPGIDGISLGKQIKALWPTPIIRLTAINDDIEKVVALETSVDDYLTKPFNLRILLAHIKALLKRSQQNGNTNKVIRFFSFVGWKLDAQLRLLLSTDDVDVALSTAEYELLFVLLKNANKTLSRDAILQAMDKPVYVDGERRIDSLIRKLRKKIEIDANQPTIIKTIRQGGYQLTAEIT